MGGQKEKMTGCFQNQLNSLDILEGRILVLVHLRAEAYEMI